MPSLLKKGALLAKAAKLRMDYNRGKEAVSNIKSAAACLNETKSYINTCQATVFSSDWIGDSANEMLSKLNTIKTNDSNISSQINSTGNSLSSSIEAIKAAEEKVLAMIASLGE